MDEDWRLKLEQESTRQAEISRRNVLVAAAALVLITLVISLAFAYVYYHGDLVEDACIERADPASAPNCVQDGNN